MKLRAHRPPVVGFRGGGVLREVFECDVAVKAFQKGKTINECRLVLHSLTVAVCQLYLALLHLRPAMKQIAECGALFLLLSTVQWHQKRVLGAGKEEWEKKQERQRQAMLNEGEQVEEFLAKYCQDAITSVNRRSRGRRTGR
ncbi:hypothetical protein E1301_Tti005517 [Triplophysa tibetana]|uniref:Uncharacterized protein n=1 Tax=Triplophysa tibetana TaxID=1572043 RepID=A0A5A9NGF5_9TELE|nr:hypothetical protein E1301_Tti005517 [Triplophysa tibetana]